MTTDPASATGPVPAADEAVEAEPPGGYYDADRARQEAGTAAVPAGGEPVRIAHPDEGEDVYASRDAAARGLAAEAPPGPEAGLTIYTVPGCPGCRMTEREADRAGLRYEVVSLADRPDLVERFRAEGLTRAPIVQGADGERTSGFRPGRIRAMAALAAPPAAVRPEAASGPGQQPPRRPAQQATGRLAR